MAFVVEDGTGLSNSNAYISVSFYDTYIADRGIVVAASTTAQKEQAIVVASDYLDTQFIFLGSKKLSTQAMEWPRTGVIDITSGQAIPSTIVPPIVQRTVAELVAKIRNGEVLLQDLARGGEVKSESVGPISVTYKDSAPAGITYRITGLLKGVIRPSDPAYGASPSTPEYAGKRFFKTGQFSLPGVLPDYEGD